MLLHYLEKLECSNLLQFFAYYTVWAVTKLIVGIKWVSICLPPLAPDVCVRFSLLLTGRVQFPTVVLDLYLKMTYFGFGSTL